MREPAAVADKEPRSQERPDNRTNARVAVLRNLIRDVMAVVVPASEADANAQLTQNRFRHLLLRHPQVIDSKGQ